MPQSHSRCAIHALDHLVLTVTSIPDTVRFYGDVLGMSCAEFAVADGSRRWALFYGAAKINLHRHGDEFEPKAQTPTPGSADLCFLTSAPIESWQRHLAQHDIEIEEGPVPRTGASGPIISLYIRDPDQNLIEISLPDPQATDFF